MVKEMHYKSMHMHAGGYGVGINLKEQALARFAVMVCMLFQGQQFILIKPDEHPY